MLQTLISLRDDQIDLVLDAVRKWCDERALDIDSDEGRRAVNMAVNLICSRVVHNLHDELRSQLENHSHAG